jgi:hypothetical protein
MGLWMHFGSHFVIAIFNNLTSSPSPRWRVSRLFFSWAVITYSFSRSLDCLKSFSDFFFKHLRPLHWFHGLASLLDYHGNHLTWVDTLVGGQSIIPPKMGHRSSGPASAWLPKSTLIWVDSTLVVPLGLPLATAPAVQPSRLTIIRTTWSEWTQSWKSPLAFIQIPPWVPLQFHKDRFCLLYIVHYLYTVLFLIVSLILFLFNYSLVLYFWSW